MSIYDQIGCLILFLSFMVFSLWLLFEQNNLESNKMTLTTQESLDQDSTSDSMSIDQIRLQKIDQVCQKIRQENSTTNEYLIKSWDILRTPPFWVGNWASLSERNMSSVSLRTISWVKAQAQKSLVRPQESAKHW